MSTGDWRPAEGWTFTGFVQTVSRLRNSGDGNPRLQLDIRVPGDSTRDVMDVRYVTAKDSQCGYATIHFDAPMVFTVNKENEITGIELAKPELPTERIFYDKASLEQYRQEQRRGQA